MSDTSKERCEEVKGALTNFTTPTSGTLSGMAASHAADLITALQERVAEVEWQLRQAESLLTESQVKTLASLNWPSGQIAKHGGSK